MGSPLQTYYIKWYNMDTSEVYAMKFKKLIISLVSLTLVLSGCAKTEVANISDANLMLQLETEHFEFYSVAADKKCLDDLSTEIESNYKRLTSDLKIDLDYKPKVYIYPNLEAFHKSINQLNAPDWAVGTAWGKDLKMVSPLNPGKSHSYETIKQVLVHEFVHVLEINIVDNPQSLHTWLWEGIACFEANQINDSAKKVLREEALNNNAPTLEELSKNFYTVQNAYQYSYSIVDFMVNTYGKDKLVEILNDYKNIEKILGISMDAFEKQWIQYIKESY